MWRVPRISSYYPYLQAVRPFRTGVGGHGGSRSVISRDLCRLVPEHDLSSLLSAANEADKDANCHWETVLVSHVSIQRQPTHDDKKLEPVKKGSIVVCIPSATAAAVNIKDSGCCSTRSRLWSGEPKVSTIHLVQHQNGYRVRTSRKMRRTSQRKSSRVMILGEVTNQSSSSALHGRAYIHPWLQRTVYEDFRVPRWHIGIECGIECGPPLIRLSPCLRLWELATCGLAKPKTIHEDTCSHGVFDTAEHRSGCTLRSKATVTSFEKDR